MEKVSVKPNQKNENLVDIKATISLGKFLSILHALELSGTPVAGDMLSLLKRSAAENNVSTR